LKHLDEIEMLMRFQPAPQQLSLYHHFSIAALFIFSSPLRSLLFHILFTPTSAASLRLCPDGVLLFRTRGSSRRGPNSLEWARGKAEMTGARPFSRFA